MERFLEVSAMHDTEKKHEAIAVYVNGSFLSVYTVDNFINTKRMQKLKQKGVKNEGI